MIDVRAVVAAVGLACVAGAIAAETPPGAPAPPEKTVKAEPSAEDILNGTAPPIDYSQAVKCLRSELIERTEPLGDRYIVFHLRGNQMWIAQMRKRCPQMGYDSKLMFVKNNPRICEWDTVRVVLDSGVIGTIDEIGEYRLGPPCNLPKFEPITQDQVNLLKQSLLHKGPKTQ
jgi:hypothetical protein